MNPPLRFFVAVVLFAAVVGGLDHLLAHRSEIAERALIGSATAAVGDDTDRCYGKPCKVASLKAGAAGVASDGGLTLVGGSSTTNCVNWGPIISGWQLCSTGVNSNLVLTAAGSPVEAQWSWATGALASTAGVSSPWFVSTGAALSGACSTAGQIEWDSSALCLKTCNGGSWSACYFANGVISGQSPMVWHAYCDKSPCTKAETATDNFVGPLISNGTTSRIVCNAHTAGTGGTTGMVVAIYDVTAATEKCNCALSCTTAAGTPANCTCATTLTAGNMNVLRLKSTTDCTAIAGQLACNVIMTQ